MQIHTHRQIAGGDRWSKTGETYRETNRTNDASRVVTVTLQTNPVSQETNGWHNIFIGYRLKDTRRAIQASHTGRHRRQVEAGQPENGGDRHLANDTAVHIHRPQRLDAGAHSAL